jgi:hypothetical protein
LKLDDKNAKIGTSRTINGFMSSIIFGCRANMSAGGAPAGTPVSVTQALADLRLSHARLLEEHGANAALLRLREAGITELEHRETELQQTVAAAQLQLHVAEEQVARRETRAALAEREVGFLQALLASYNAEQEAVDAETRIDLAKVQQIEDLQKLLEEYKESNQQLEKILTPSVGKPPCWMVGKAGKTSQKRSRKSEPRSCLCRRVCLFCFYFLLH